MSEVMNENKRIPKPMFEKACEFIVALYDDLVSKGKIALEKEPSEITSCRHTIENKKKRIDFLKNARIPKKDEIWIHRNGRNYKVLFLANDTKDPNTTYETYVVYQSVDSGTYWTRPLADWHRSFGMNPIEEAASSFLEDEMENIKLIKD
jgi:hypothetical protein